MKSQVVYPFLSEMFCLSKKDSLDCPALPTKVKPGGLKGHDFPLPSRKEGRDTIARGLVIEL